MAATLQQAKSQIDALLRAYITGVPATSLIPIKATKGKVYEALVLGHLCEKLVLNEQLTLHLSGGPKLKLKSSPSPINQQYPYIQVHRNGMHVANIFTDTEFTSLSCVVAGNLNQPTNGEYHELDILVADPTAIGRPKPQQIWLGVECKHTAYKKALLRETLGVRRELSFYQNVQIAARFYTWPRSLIPADPPVCLLVCSSDSNIMTYAVPGVFFGIDFEHVPI